MKRDSLIIVRGGGDLATGTIHRLWSAGLRVLVLETEHPAAIRRQVSLCEAFYEGETTVEGLRAVRISKQEEAEAVWAQNAVPVLIDPKGESIRTLKPDVVVDAILAKKNLGTTREMASLTIALARALQPGRMWSCSGGDQTRPQAGTDHPGGRGDPQHWRSGCHWRLCAERVLHSPHRAFSATCTPSAILSRPGRPLPRWKHRGRRSACKNAESRGSCAAAAGRLPCGSGFSKWQSGPAQKQNWKTVFSSRISRCIAGSVLEL